MSGTRLRQIARLERRALPFLERKRQYDEQTAERLRDGAFTIAANLALLILFGDPKMDEPLSYAWQCALNAEAWTAYPDYLVKYERYNESEDTSVTDLGVPPIDEMPAQLRNFFAHTFCQIFLAPIRPRN
jgi:hypothetical protein